MHSRLKYCKALGALAVLAALGCGDKNLVPVKGVVTLDGQPVEGALVKFIPTVATAEQGHEAMGDTDESGEFSLTTIKPGDGAWRGVYKVCVQKIVIDPAYVSKMPDPTPDETTDGKTANSNRGQMAQAMRHKINLFPKKYMNANSTPIEITVPHDGPVQIDIKSEPGGKRG